ncbi:TIGR01906 family membrane protein [Chloroflexota bacterium]
MILRILKITAKSLFILCFPVLLLTASIAGAINCSWLYQYGFQKYHISQTTGIENTELEKAARGLRNYFNSGEEYINVTIIKDSKPFPLFNDREIKHLKDVKQLFWLDYEALAGTLLYVLGYSVVSLFWYQKRHQLAKGVLGGSILTLMLTLLLGLGALFSFDQLFLQFHLLSFANDFWMLDPTHDYLLMLFPQGFWYDTTLFCALATVAGALILGGISAGYLLTRRESMI